MCDKEQGLCKLSPYVAKNKEQGLTNCRNVLQRTKNKGYIIAVMCEKEQRTRAMKVSPCVTKNEERRTTAMSDNEQRTMTIKLPPCVTKSKEQGLYNYRHV